MEPYHTPYTPRYRYWMGLLLLVRVLLLLISILNFTLDPRLNLISTILVIGCLLFVKVVTASRVYKSWPLDVMETGIYFNLIMFSALTLSYYIQSWVDQRAVVYIINASYFGYLTGYDIK